MAPSKIEAAFDALIEQHDGVFSVDATMMQIRDDDKGFQDALDSALDEAQGYVFASNPEAWVVIKVTK